MSVYEDGAHARNKFENRRLNKTMEHIAFTQRYAQTRLDDEIRSLRDNLRDIRKNTGHSSSMDSDGVRSFCRGQYIGSQQKRAAEQINRGECFDWTLTLDRDMDTVKVPDIEHPLRTSRSRQTGVRRSASLKNSVSDTGAHGMLPVVSADPATADLPEEGSLKRSSSFHGTSRRSSMRKPQQQKTVGKQTEGTKVKRAESFQGVTQDGHLPQSGLRRASSTQSLRGSLQSGGRQKSVSMERIDTLPLDISHNGSFHQHQRPTHRDTESIKLPQITKVSAGAAELPRRERARQKRKQRGAKTSDPYDIDLNSLVQDIIVDDGVPSDTASARGRQDRSSSRTRTKLKPLGKPQKPPKPVLAWEPESTRGELYLPAVSNTDPRGSTSCPLPERQKSDMHRSSRKLSCPEDDEQLVAEADTNGEDDVFGSTEAQEEADSELAREARKKKVLNARAANNGMSFAEFRSKRQGDIKVAMSPRQLRRIREQIIQQRNRKDSHPSAGEQVRYKHIEDKVRSFLDHEMFNQSECGSATDSYNSEEEGALV